MRSLPNITGPVSYGEASWETGDTPEASTGQSARQELIHQANTVPLTSVFKHFGVRHDGGRNNVTCPLKSHQGGRESSGSFRFYPDSNSFYCFGCKIGGKWAHACEFLAAMDGTSREQAARKIIKLFGNELDSVYVDDADAEDGAAKLAIMLDFSNIVREFRETYLDEKSIAFIEDKCAVYDNVNFKKKPDAEALRRIVEELKEVISKYKP